MTHPPSQHTHTRIRTQLSIAQDADGWLYVVCNVCDKRWLAGNYNARKSAYTCDRIVMQDAEKVWQEAQGGH